MYLRSEADPHPDYAPAKTYLRKAIDLNPGFGEVHLQLGIIFQDDLKINQRVTFNYGLRYEYQTPWVEKFNRLFGFDPATGNVVTAGTSIPTDLVPVVASTLPIVSASQAGYPTRSLLEDGRK